MPALLTELSKAMRTVFVTGANGFIGTHLVRALRARGDRVRRMVWEFGKTRALPDPSRSEADTLVASLDEIDAMERAIAGCDLVFHLAGRTAAYRRADFEHANARGADQLLTAALRARPGPRRVVIVSSSMAAGPSRPGIARREAHAVEPGHTLYGDSKLGGEKAAFAAARRSDVELVIVRPPAVYGPGDQDMRLLIRSAAAGLIAQPGLSPPVFSAIFVEDLVAGLLLVADRGRPLPRQAVRDHVLAGGGARPDAPVPDPEDPRGAGIYHLCDGGRYTATELGRLAAAAVGRRAVPVRFPAWSVYLLAFGFEQLGKLIGRLPTLTIDKARGSLLSWWCDDHKAREALGFSSRLDLAGGMRETVAALGLVARPGPPIGPG